MATEALLDSGMLCHVALLACFCFTTPSYSLREPGGGYKNPPPGGLRRGNPMKVSNHDA